MIEIEEKKEFRDIKIDYYLNNYDKKECIIKFDNKKGFITYKELTENFFQYLKSTYTKKEEEEDEEYYEYKDNYILNQLDINKSNIFYEYIRYLENGGWQLLNQNGIIGFNDINEINIIIKASIISKANLIKKERYDLIEKQLKKITLNINKQFNNNKLLLDNNNININNNNKDIIDIVILISNPLMDEEKELRTLNDYNKIVSSIQDLIKDSFKSINIQYLPLTKENFIDTIKKKPIILHLIFKSIYDINNINKAIKNSSDITFLIFEKKNYNIDYINKEKIISIFALNEELKQNIKNINLIISTSLAKDVYDIFNLFKFRNILVEHTTLANIDFISEFNYFFYENILENKNCDIYDAYLSSLYQNSFNNITQFCCCFHQHDINEKCDLVKNIKKELYIQNDINIHFTHLNYNCECNKLYKNFSYHYDNCENMKKNGGENDINNEVNEVMINNKSNCCCKKKNKHSLEVAFYKSFKAQKTKNNKNKNNNNIINIGRNFEMKLMGGNSNTIPNYEKMILLVGKNKIIFDIMNFLDQSINNKKLNIYNDEIFYLKQLAESIIEYSKERLILNYFIQYDIKSSEDFDNLESEDNTPLIHLNKNKMKYIYFVFIHDTNESIINKENILKFGNKYKIIFFSKNEMKIDDKNMIKLKIEDLSKYDYYIKYQKEKIRFKTEKSFEEYISSKMKNESI